MIKQGHEWTGDPVERCDVVVIGSGLGGATVARRLAELGRDVIVVDRAGYDGLARIEDERGLEASDDAAVSLTFGRASLRDVRCRTPRDRLERWALPGHDLGALTPWFERIERELDVRLPDGTEAGRIDDLLREAASGLGWRAAQDPRAHRDAGALGSRVFSDLDAVRLRWDGPRVRALVCRALDRATGRPAGPTVTIEPRAVVVAAGGSGTPRFLLKQGLKESLPHVGEHLFVNPCARVHARFDEPVLERSPSSAWAVDEFRVARTEGDRYVEGGYLLSASRLPPDLLAAALPGIGARHRALMRDLPRLGGTVAWIEDAEEGRITLESGGRTRLHVPLRAGTALRIRDAWKKQATLLFQAGAREVIFGDAADTRITSASQIEAAVAGISLEPGHNLLAAPHPGGGARMGAGPTDSVVGPDHRVHGSDNLFVSDPSVFPSPPSVDPSLSTLAFACVAAEHVHAAV